MNFDKPEHDRSVPEIPERLIRLDRELKTERTKQMDYLNAVRTDEFGQDVRVRICVMRQFGRQSDGFRYIATCSVGGKVRKAFDDQPSHAFVKLIGQIKDAVGRQSFERQFSKNDLSMTQESQI